jgi:Helix-turn-helix domain
LPTAGTIDIAVFGEIAVFFLKGKPPGWRDCQRSFFAVVWRSAHISISKLPYQNSFILSSLFVRQNFKPNEWISQAEAARIRGVSPQAITQLIQKGRFKPLEIGGRLLLRRVEVENYRAKPPGRPKNQRKNRKR